MSCQIREVAVKPCTTGLDTNFVLNFCANIAVGTGLVLKLGTSKTISELTYISTSFKVDPIRLRIGYFVLGLQLRIIFH